MGINCGGYNFGLEDSSCHGMSGPLEVAVTSQSDLYVQGVAHEERFKSASKSHEHPGPEESCETEHSLMGERSSAPKTEEFR